MRKVSLRTIVFLSLWTFFAVGGLVVYQVDPCVSICGGMEEGGYVPYKEHLALTNFYGAALALFIPLLVIGLWSLGYDLTRKMEP